MPNIQTISDGTGEDQHFTYVVDPNGLGTEAVNQDDLYCWVSLKAYPRDRSIITTEGSFGNFGKDVVDLISSKKYANGKKYLTTDYTLVGGLDSNDECFGVENITITTGANQVSSVKIKFVDAQGGALFNNHEIISGQGYNNSKYNVFFRQPYCIFELIVKGYYGKPVTYYLNLTDIKFTFSADTASFIGDAQFIPYNYAFLSDISIKQVAALNSSKLGQSYIDNYIDDGRNVMRIDKMLKSFEGLNDTFDTFKKENKNSDSLKNISKAELLLKQISTNLGIYKKGFDTDNVNGLTDNSNYTIANICVLDYNYKTDYESFVKKINIDINDYNEIIDENFKLKIFVPTLNNYVYKTNELFDIIKSIISDKDKDINLTNLTNDKITKSLTTVDKFTIVDFSTLRLKVSDLSIKLNDEKNKIYKNIVEELNGRIEKDLGFKPTLYEVFRVLCSNVDIYLKILYDVSVKAENMGVERVGYLKNQFQENNNLTDIPFKDNKIYPFPAVYGEDGKRAWIGDIVGEDNAYYPEIGLVNSILSGYVDKTDKKVDVGKLLSVNPTTNHTNFYNHPLDIYADEYQNYENFDFSNNPSKDLVDVINKRFVTFSKYSGYKNVFDFANLDALYFYNKTKGGKFQDLINSYDENTFNELLLNYHTFNTDYIVNGINLEKTSLLETTIKTDNTQYQNIKDFIEKKGLLNITVGDKRGHYKIVDNIVYKDLTDFYDDSSIRERIYKKYQKTYNSTINENSKNCNGVLADVINEVQFIDGYEDGTGNKTNNLFSKIGLNIESAAYANADKFGKSFLFLKNFPFYGLDSFSNEINKNSLVIHVNKLYLAYLGGLIYYNENVSVLYSDNYKQFLLKYFIDFIDNVYKPTTSNGFESIVLKYRAYKNTRTFDTQYERLYDEVTKYIFQYIDVVVVNPFAIYNENHRETLYPQITNTTVQQYGSQWLQWFKYYYKKEKVNNVTFKPITSKVTDDRDLKIAIYHNLATMYNMWLSFGKENHKIYNFSTYLGVSDKDNRRLIDHFLFVDRNYSDIGDKVVINPNILAALYSKIDMNMNGFIGEILKESNFIFTALPTKVEYTNKQDVLNIFKPLTHYDNIERGSSYICMWTGGNSQVLDIDSTTHYFNDGFDLRPNSVLPHNFLYRNTPNRYKRASYEDLKDNDVIKIKNRQNLAVFRVGFSDQNQSIFKSIDVGMSEHGATFASLNVQADLFDGKGNGNRLYKGIDLYDMYMKNSYMCSVNCMGAMQILPMMYFQLDNIPMFHGCYIIYNVEHTITANNVETKFSGRRLQKYTYPVIDKVTTWFNFTIEDFLKEEDKIVDNTVNVAGEEITDPNGKFQRAMNKTLDNEGVFEKETARSKDDGGNYYKGEFYGTGYGVTAQFVVDFLKQMPTKEMIKNQTRESASKIWYNTAWQWMKGDSIKNQQVIDLTLDWMTQAQGRCTKEICKILGYDKKTTQSIVDRVYFTDKMVEDINNFDAKTLHDKIKERRLYYVNNKETSQYKFGESISRRIERYVF